MADFDATQEFTGPQLLSVQRHILQLMEAAQKERNPSIRRTLNQMLDQACRMLGINTPELALRDVDESP